MTDHDAPNVIAITTGKVVQGRSAKKVIVTDRRLVRMKARMVEKQVSQSALADMIGVTPSAVSLIFSGKIGRTKHFPAIARALDVDLGWLLGLSVGEFDEDQRELGMHLADKMASTMAMLPEVDLQTLYAEFHCGIPVTPRKIAFGTDVLAMHTTADPDFVVAAQGIGDGMQPTLLDTDLLLIDASRQRLDRPDRLWLVRYAGLLSIKRLRPTPDGVQMASDNPNVPDQDGAARDVAVLGLVVGFVRKV